MWIYLLRHGIAEDSRPGLADEDRALTKEGVARLEAAAGTWRRLVPPPELVICSPLLRARETAALFASAVGYENDSRIDESLVPHAMPEQTLTVLEGELLCRTESVALVGHEPHLGYLLGALLTGHTRLSIALKKGMLIGLQTDSATNVIASLRFSMGQKLASKLT
jgi:phosphohistidine phosphatase